MGTTATASDDRRLLLQLLEEAYDRPTWNETNLRSSIRGVSAEAAGWTPPGGRRSITDIVVHCAYWKYAIRRRIRNDPRGSFPLKGSNWFRLERPLTRARWSDAVSMLDVQHDQLRDAIATASLRLSFARDPGRDLVRRIFGVAMHDAYHTGQVRLIKAMWKRTSGGKRLSD